MYGICDRENWNKKVWILKLSKTVRAGDDPVGVEGAVHSIRNMGELAFIILRRECGLIQTVWEDQKTNMDISQLHDGDYIRVEGTVRIEPRAVHGREVRISTITVLSAAAAPLPLPVAKWKLNTSLETKLNLRPHFFKKYP